MREAMALAGTSSLARAGARRSSLFSAAILACAIGSMIPGAADGSLTSTTEPAAWTRVADGAGGLVVFYAKVPTGGKGKRRSVQLLYDYNAPQQDPDSLISHRSAVVSVVVDCAANRISMGDMVKYDAAMGHGDKVEQTRSADRSFRKAAAESINWKVVRFACSEVR